MQNTRKTKLTESLLKTLDELHGKSYELKGEEWQENNQAQIEILKQLRSLYEN